MKQDCLICKRIQKIRNADNPYFVKELKTGYVVIGDYQFFKGYTLFLYKHHKEELHELTTAEKTAFLSEMAIVAEAVYKAFKPEKLNYELLGNSVRHMHWHLFPRYIDDPQPKRTIWVIDKSIREAENTRPSNEKLLQIKLKLSNELKNLYNNEQGFEPK